MRGRGPRRTASVGFAVLAVTLSTAGCSGVTLTGTTPSATINDSGSSAPSTSTSTGPTAPPDATLRDLDDIVIPAYCQQPATRLHSGTIAPSVPASTRSTTWRSESSAGESRSSGASTSGGAETHGGGEVVSSADGSDRGSSSGGSARAGETGHGELSMTGPEAPVLADVTGDGAKEVVAQYTCNAGGTTWPAMLIVVTHGGDVVGTVKLGDISRTEHARVTAWRAADEGLVVDWVAYEGAGLDKRPNENLLKHTGSSVSFTPTERGRALAQTTIVDGPEKSSFVTPTGKIACTLDGTNVTCAVQQPSWKSDGDTTCSGVDAVVLRNGRAAYDCTSGGPFRQAAGGASPGWQRQGSDPTIRGTYGEMPALAFGRTLTTGQITCTSAISGVTCSDPMSGHGFTVSGDVARLF